MGQKQVRSPSSRSRTGLGRKKCSHLGMSDDLVSDLKRQHSVCRFSSLVLEMKKKCVVNVRLFRYQSKFLIFLDVFKRSRA